MIDLDTSPDRDSWCTPPAITALLPVVDLDPCSNSRSTVRARYTYSLERDQDGLALPWFGMLYINGPFSDLLPWAERLQREYDPDAGAGHVFSAGVLCNLDPSTKWYKAFQRVLPLRFDFDKRIRFEPPPGVKSSSNSKPQALLCDEAFWKACDPALAEHGVLWRRS